MWVGERRKMEPHHGSRHPRRRNGRRRGVRPGLSPPGADGRVFASWLRGSVSHKRVNVLVFRIELELD
jgi:hypothetical protein